MKMFLVATACALAGPAWAGGQHAHGDDHKPLHGGIVAEGKAFDMELVARPAVLQLYLRDHGKPKAAANASARLTLLAGTDKQEVTLKPAGDRLEATGSFKVPAGTKVVAVVTVAGTPSTARFTLK